MCIYVYLHTHTHIYICIYIYIGIHLYIYIHTYVYMYMYIYIHIYIYICIYIHTYVHIYTYVHILIYILQPLDHDAGRLLRACDHYERGSGLMDVIEAEDMGMPGEISRHLSSVQNPCWLMISWEFHHYLLFIGV